MASGQLILSILAVDDVVMQQTNLIEIRGGEGNNADVVFMELPSREEFLQLASFGGDARVSDDVA